MADCVSDYQEDGDDLSGLEGHRHFSGIVH
jgi:hypothetical protein